MTAHGADGALSACTCTGHLVINGVSMHNPAWCVLDVIELWPGNAKQRGDNVIVEGVDGQLAYPMEIEQTDYLLPLMVSGELDHMGNPDSDGTMARLYRNLAYLRSLVYGPVDGTTATWDAHISLPTGGTVYADVQVLDIARVWHFRQLTKTTLTLRVPAGEFV